MFGVVRVASSRAVGSWRCARTATTAIAARLPPQTLPQPAARAGMSGFSFTAPAGACRWRLDWLRCASRPPRGNPTATDCRLTQTPPLHSLAPPHACRRRAGVQLWRARTRRRRPRIQLRRACAGTRGGRFLLWCARASPGGGRCSRAGAGVFVWRTRAGTRGGGSACPRGGDPRVLLWRTRTSTATCRCSACARAGGGRVQL